MKILIPKLFLIYILFLLNFIILPYQGMASVFSEYIEFILIDYIHPEAQLVTGVSKTDIKYQSNHKIFIGNQTHIQSLKNLFENLPVNKDSEMRLGSISFMVTFREKSGQERVVYVDYKGNFEFFNSNIKGVLPRESFEELTEICVTLSNSIDLKFLNGKLRDDIIE